MVRKLRQIAKYRSALTNDGALRSRYKAIIKWSPGYNISLTYISKFLNKSVSWVDKYKEKARKLNWITVKHDYKKTGVKWQDRATYLNYYRISTGRAKKYKGILFLVSTDILRSRVLVTKWKKVMNEERMYDFCC